MKKLRSDSRLRLVSRLLPLCLIFALLFSLFPGASLAQEIPPWAKLHPSLREIALEAGPSPSVRVIVQAAGSLDALSAAIRGLGGAPLRQLSLIDAVLADLPATRLVDVARLSAVRVISPDAPVVKSGNFGEGAVVYQQDFNGGVVGIDSSLNWNWSEVGEADGFALGEIAITPFLGGTAEGVRLQSPGKGVQAGLDLRQAASATFSMTFRRKGFVSAQDGVLLHISSDGGLQWQEITRLSGPATDPALQMAHFDLTAFRGRELLVRLVVGPETRDSARFYLDFVQVVYEVAPQTHKHQVLLPHVAAPGASLDQSKGGLFSASGSYRVRDEFNAVSYGNNDGTVNWSGGWMESGDNGSPSGGDITVEVDECPDDSSRCIEFDGDADLNSYIAREVNLSMAGAATLTFDYHLDEQDALYLLEVSADGGFTWQTVKSYSTPAVVLGESVDLSAYSAAATRIRFRLADREDTAHLSIDNVQIEWTVGSVTPQPVVGITTVRDEFNAVGYGNNNGSANWSGSWIEQGDNNSPSSGRITVEIDECPNGANQCIEFDARANLNTSIEREANLGAGNSALLSFDYHLDKSGAQYVLEASPDGGVNWHTLKSYSLPAIVIGEKVDLTAYATPATRIRFRLTDGEETAHLSIDNVQIEWGDNDYIDTSNLASTYVKSISADYLWNRSGNHLRGNNITVAVVDSGIATHLDLDDDEDDDDDGDGRRRSRVLAHVDFSGGGALDDFYGHGTHVAGIIAGNGFKSNDAYMGVAPRADLVDVKVTDDYGVGLTSDVVDGLGWVLDHKEQYNIRVVNMSLNSTVAESYHDSPLDAAIEILWFNGIVVVVSGGNNGRSNAGVVYPPANDPFVISVGAVDDRGSRTLSDDVLAAYTAYGVTTDGFVKPEIVAPGSNIIASLSGDDSNLALDHPAHAVEGTSGTYYFRMSGTSMASAVVAGAVAILLEEEPGLSPDQVKYRLMETASHPFEMALETPAADGSTLFRPAYMDIRAAVEGTTVAKANEGVMPNRVLAKMAMMAYWASSNGGGEIDWASVNWNSVNWNSVNWNSVNWNSVNWNSVNWNSVNWDGVDWGAIHWNSGFTWSSVNWNSGFTWSSVNWNSGFTWSSGFTWGSVHWDD